MQVKYKNQTYTLGKKDRNIEAEAPAVRIKMLNEETKVIGMLAPFVQVMITLNDIKLYDGILHEMLTSTKKKVLTYIITTSSKEEIEKVTSTYSLDRGMVSNEYKDFSLKFGVNIDDLMIANSLFIIDKEGIIKYKQIPSDIEEHFNIEEFSISLNETVNFKPKGHTHENWMGV